MLVCVFVFVCVCVCVLVCVCVCESNNRVFSYRLSIPCLFPSTCDSLVPTKLHQRNTKKKLYRNVVVSTAVAIHILVFYVVTQYRLVGEHQRFDGKYFPFIQGWKSTPMYRSKRSAKQRVPTYFQTTTGVLISS